jgi:exodeoxyribonuclease III
MKLHIATWNVNSILARLTTALTVLKAIDADIVCLQELKCEEARFPRQEIEDLGYNVAVLGQKTYNGVAILSRHRIDEVTTGLPGFADDQARYIEAVIGLDSGAVRAACIYAPNGNPVDGPKLPYKLAFMDALAQHMQSRLAEEEVAVFAGDYNVIPRPEDCHDPSVWANDALFRPDSRAALRRLIHLGYRDAFEQADGRGHQYSFWDYQAGAWQKDHGIRIDHLLLSPQASDRLAGVQIYRNARALEKPSDHVPVIATLNL